MLIVLSQMEVVDIRFNRYMVECECVQQLCYFPVSKVLIDTWWNVNFFKKKVRYKCFLVLIDTWWNVNCGGYFTKR